MRRGWPDFKMLAFALRRRLQRLLGREPDFFSHLPAGLELSPSARHFAGYATAPLALSFKHAKGDVSNWQTSARAKLAELAGYGRSAQVPGIVHEARSELPGGFSRRTFYLDAGSAVNIPVHFVEPKNPPAHRPVMICLQGTGTGAHLSWGEVRYPADLAKSQHGYDIAIQAAQRGYLAVAVEQSCFGERAERQISPRSTAPCVDATMHAFLLGRSLIGERCSDVSAVIDWLISAREVLGIDAQRIYAMGHSSGGSVALVAAALDMRIAGILACGCVGYFRETIGRRRDDQGQNVIPGILNWMEFADIVGLVAPRPFATVAGDADHIWPAAGALAVVAEAQTIYSQLGAAPRLHCVGAPGGHHFRPAVSWQAFEKVLAAADP
jgi:dienelactone hydrolase